MNIFVTGASGFVGSATPVHDKGDKGFIPFLIGQARKSGISAYPEKGENHWSAVHRLDAAKAFRLAVEKAEKGTVYNVVSDQAIETKTKCSPGRVPNSIFTTN